MPLALKLTVSKAEPVHRGQEHFWRVIRTLGVDGRPFTASNIAAVSSEPHAGTITTWLRRLSKAGVLSKNGRVANAATGRLEACWRLLQNPEQAPIVSRDGSAFRPRSARQQMWNVMRGPSGRTGFTWRDLVAYASTDDLVIRPNSAKSYIQELKQGGYFIQLDPGGPNRPALWRLRPAMNSGPLPPMVMRAKLVFDQNRRRVAGEVVAEEERP